MTYEQFQDLAARLTAELCLDGMTEMMIPTTEARRRLAAAEASTPKPQWWLKARFDALAALVALGRLGALK
jgi:hypothetical protein